MKKSAKKGNRFRNTPRSAKGMGDYYGTGIVAKLGRLRDSTVGMVNLSPKELSKPPKSLA